MEDETWLSLDQSYRDEPCTRSGEDFHPYDCQCISEPLPSQIVLSHFARSTEDLGPTESFVSRQLRTTMDVVCSEWIEFFHGGLHLQVTHHLFPRIPRHNLRRASKLVKEYCKEQDIEYAEYSFTEGNKRVLGVLRDVANQVSLLTKVAEADARGQLH